MTNTSAAESTTGEYHNPPTTGAKTVGLHRSLFATMLRLRGVHFDPAVPPVVPPPAPVPVPPPAPEPTPKPKGNFQLALEAVRNEGKAEREALAAERDRLKTELETLRKGVKKDDDTYAEGIRKPLLDEIEKHKTRETKRAEKIKRQEVVNVTKGLVVEGAEDDVVASIIGELSLNEDDAVEVIELVDGKPRRRYGADGAMTVKDRVLDLLKTKPYLAAPSVRSGLGLKDSPRGSSLAASVDQIKADIAEAEGKKDFVKAGRLKTQLIQAMRDATKK